MKVAITHPYSWPEVRRGAERIVVETAGALARRGHEVTLITAGSTAGHRRDEAGFDVIQFRRLHDNTITHERWFAMRVFAVLARNRFDAVHAMMARDAKAAIRAKRFGGHRVVYEELGNPSRSWWASIGETRLRTDVVARADTYGCMSHYALHVLRRDHDRRGALIPGGVDLDSFRPTDRDAQPTILFSGALDVPRKGVALLLDAVSLLMACEPDVQLWLSGPGDVDPILASAPADARDRTTMLGLGDARGQGERYARAWVTALPSIGDSFGMVLLESLACGTPIVALDDAAPPELVTPATGALAQPGDAASLADALARGLSLARDRATAQRCRAKAETYSWDVLAARLEAIYRGQDLDDTPDIDERVAVAGKILAQPPRVHQMGGETGVWSTDDDCYTFLATVSAPGARTLETGCGLSTVMFAALGTDHTCVAPGTEEIERIRRHCDEHGIDGSRVEFVAERSEIALPRLMDGPPLDVVLVDGSHGHPMPTIDWFYACSRLRRGGAVVIDDLQLPAPAQLASFLGGDPRWQLARRTPKWAAYVRDADGPISEDWFTQPFFHTATGRELVQQLGGRLKSRMSNVLRR